MTSCIVLAFNHLSQKKTTSLDSSVSEMYNCQNEIYVDLTIFIGRLFVLKFIVQLNHLIEKSSKNLQCCAKSKDVST